MPNDKTCFLSYAHEDVASAQRLYDSLTRRGIRVWFDRESLQPGERWESAIRREIRAARYFLALLSSRSVSKKGFVQKEIRQGLEVLSEYPDDEIYLIPLRIDECSPTHDRLRELQWVDLFPSWEDGFARLTRFLDVETTPLAAPTSQPVASDWQSHVRLRFDGLYESDRQAGPQQTSQQHYYWQYLRFYDDGLVLTVSTNGPQPSQIARWFTRESNAGSKGTYSLTGRRITFAATSSSGTVDYEGRIEGDTIIVKHHSHINGNRGVTQFDFRPIAT